MKGQQSASMLAWNAGMQGRRLCWHATLAGWRRQASGHEAPAGTPAPLLPGHLSPPHLFPSFSAARRSAAASAFVAAAGSLNPLPTASPWPCPFCCCCCCCCSPSCAASIAAMVWSPDVMRWSSCCFLAAFLACGAAQGAQGRAAACVGAQCRARAAGRQARWQAGRPLHPRCAARLPVCPDSAHLLPHPTPASTPVQATPGCTAPRPSR